MEAEEEIKLLQTYPGAPGYHRRTDVFIKESKLGKVVMRTSSLCCDPWEIHTHGQGQASSCDCPRDMSCLS